MDKPVSSIDDILKALPAVQEAVRQEIQARIDAGEKIASMSDAEMRERSRALHKERARSIPLQKKSAA